MTDADLQQRLSVAGYDCGPIDGKRGPKTYAALFEYVAGRKLGATAQALGRGANAHFGDTINTPLRIAHFIAQGAHETGGFIFFKELGGPSYFKKYDGRKDLGNIQPGDGARFAGRGMFQLTGRANYTAAAKETGLDFVGKPEMASDPELSVLLAVNYWKSRNINPKADADDLEGVTRKINGGLNGLVDRAKYLARAKAVILP
jgi:putative chitinase